MLPSTRAAERSPPEEDGAGPPRQAKVLLVACCWEAPEWLLAWKKESLGEEDHCTI
jgi:hypothetical protein